MTDCVEPKAEKELVLRNASQVALSGNMSAEELATLTRCDSVRGAIQVVGQFAVIVALGTLNLCLLPDANDMAGQQGDASTVWWYVVMFAQALAMSTLHYGLHECVHRTTFEDGTPEHAWLNGFFAGIYGFLCFQPPAHFRCAHFNHHRFTGDPERDPEMQDTLAHMRPTSVWRYALILTGVPHWVVIGATVRHGILELVLPAEGLYLTKHTRREVLREAWYFSAAYTAIISSAFAFRPAAEWWYDLVLFGWLAPLFLGQPFRQLMALSEHNGCAAGADMLRNSRTVGGTFDALAVLTWGAPFHAEHHAFPNVPFHARSRLHSVLRRRAGAKCNVYPAGYGKFHGELFALLRPAAS